MTIAEHTYIYIYNTSNVSQTDMDTKKNTGNFVLLFRMAIAPP